MTVCLIFVLLGASLPGGGGMVSEVSRFLCWSKLIYAEYDTVGKRSRKWTA